MSMVVALKLHPDRFQISGSGEIGWHRSGFRLKRAMNSGSKSSQKMVKSHAAKVGGTEQEAVTI